MFDSQKMLFVDHQDLADSWAESFDIDSHKSLAIFIRFIYGASHIWTDILAHIGRFIFVFRTFFVCQLEGKATVDPAIFVYEVLNLLE